MSPIEIVNVFAILGGSFKVKFFSRIIVLLFVSSLLIPFQNCAVYESEGRKAFESTLESSSNQGCYPYIDSNLAMQYIGIVNGTLSISKTKVFGEDAYTCDFLASAHLLSQINCKVSVGNAEHTLMVKQDGVNAFDNIESIWTATATPGFVGSNHVGYVAMDESGMYIVKFLALDAGDLKGVGCSVRLTPVDYNSATATVNNTLSKIAFEMAINNIE